LPFLKMRNDNGELELSSTADWSEIQDPSCIAQDWGDQFQRFPIRGREKSKLAALCPCRLTCLVRGAPKVSLTYAFVHAVVMKPGYRFCEQPLMGARSTPLFLFYLKIPIGLASNNAEPAPSSPSWNSYGRGT
jgi:hypothetical protein